MSSFDFSQKPVRSVNQLRQRLNRRIDWLEGKLRNQERLIREQQQAHLKLRMKLKALSQEKFNVVFVCHRPALWSSLRSVFEAFLNDPTFNVFIVAIPNKKQLPKINLLHEIYDDEGAYNFFQKKFSPTIKGYDDKTEKWFDLTTLEPDVVFFQTAYDICRPPMYHSKVVASYCHIGYVPYDGQYLFNEVIADSCFPSSFATNVSLIFAESDFRKERLKLIIDNTANNLSPQIFVTGNPAQDGLEELRLGVESQSWHLPRRNHFRILWTPRWTVKEGNCHFLDYKDLLLDYAEDHPDVEFLFRPHPQAFLNYVADDVMTEDRLQSYLCRYDEVANASIDEQAEYLTTMYSCDVLISDCSNMLNEFMLTGQPIIYCNRVNTFHSQAARITSGYYWANNWAELREALEMLKGGQDQLRIKRKAIIAKEFLAPKGGAGQQIKNHVKNFLLNRSDSGQAVSHN